MSLRDRVQVVTATTGNGAVALGAAVAGYRTFASAYGANATVSYVINDGVAWETGVGTFNFAANTMTRAPDASSTGAALVLTGAATVGVAYLSRDHAADWPFAQISLSGNQGMTPNNFNTIMVDTAVTDTHAAFTGANAQYTVPQAGVYDILLAVRLLDDGPANQSYGVGVHTSNGDGPWFHWHNTGNFTGPARYGAEYRRIAYFAAGDPLRAFYYCGFAHQIDAVDFAVLRVR